MLGLVAMSVLMTSMFSGSSISIVRAQGEELVAAADAIVPSDVEEVQAMPGDGEVLVQWKAATDNVAVVGYKVHRGTHSLTEENPRYDLPSIPVGNVTSYRIKDLTNNQAYYFSVSAIDAAGNESEYYSPEATTTPKTGLRLSSIEDDGKSPKVEDVSAEDIISVTVEFSEPVKLPEQNPESAFVIEAEDKTRLSVQKAEIDTRDDTGKTVVLTTAPQKDGTEYVVTAGIEVKDYFNNPVISGTSDTGSFTGSSKQKPGTTVTPGTDIPGGGANDTQPPLITASVADFNDRISVTFSEPVVLPTDPTTHITVKNHDNEAPLAVKNVSLSTDGATLYITTDPMQGIVYDLWMSDIADAKGNTAIEGLRGTVTGKVDGTGRDTTPPENITELIANIKNAPRGILELRWKESANTQRDSADQLLYQSVGKNTSNFGHASSLGAASTAAEIQDLQTGWYTFKITTKDNAGNESSGSIISKFLPETGPGMLAAGVTSLLMGLYRRKKKNSK